MIKLDDTAYNFLRVNGLTVTGETKEDLEVRIEITDGLEKGEIDNEEKLEAKMYSLFEEAGKKVTEEDINRVKSNIVTKRKSHLIENIVNYTRILKNQDTPEYREKLEESQAEFDRLERDSNSFFEKLFDQKGKTK